MTTLSRGVWIPRRSSLGKTNYIVALQPLQSIFLSIYLSWVCSPRYYVDPSFNGSIVNLWFVGRLLWGNNFRPTFPFMHIILKISMIDQIFYFILQIDIFISIMAMVMIKAIIFILVAGSGWCTHGPRPLQELPFLYLHQFFSRERVKGV